MKNTILTTIFAATLATIASAQQSSFTDWNNSGWIPGDTSGSAEWATYGTVSATYSNTHGEVPEGVNSLGEAVFWPQVGRSQGDLDEFGADLTTSGALTFLTGGENGEAGTNGVSDSSKVVLSFANLEGGASSFPKDSVLYLTDNDVEAVIIEATLNGVAVDVSGWYIGNVQTNSGTLSDNPDDNFPAFGEGSGFDPVTGTTIPSGRNAEFFVQQFKPDTEFDTLTLTNTFARNGRIGVTLGNVVVPVPEPSSTTLLGLGAISLIIRRKR